MVRPILAILLAAAVGACKARPAPVFPAGALVDLSHAYDDKAIFWPTAEAFHLEKVADGMTPAGFYYAANDFRTSEHGGTHIDSPIHFAQGRQTVDQIPLERLVGPAVIVDVTEAASRNPDYQVTVADIEGAESRDGLIADGSIVLIRTGFSKRWPDAATYLGTAERGEAAVAKLHFPGLQPAAAAWLVANRSIAAIGIDTASIDYGQSTLFESHRILGAANVPVFENLARMRRLPRANFTFIGLPMKSAGGSGAPLRAIAIVPARR